MTPRPGLTQDVLAIHHETFVQAFAAGAADGAITATATQRMGALPRDMRVDSVQFSLPAGFAANASAYWTIALKSGSTVVAQWSTQSTGSGGNGAITANTPVTLVNSSTDANLVMPSSTVPTLVFTKTGAPANLPPGQFDIYVRNVS